MPLTDEAARQLLATHEHSGSLEGGRARADRRGAEGNPLYLEELLNAFADGTASGAGEHGRRRSRRRAC